MNKPNPSLNKIIIAVTGASGAIYAQLLLNKIEAIYKNETDKVGVVFSKTAKEVWEFELGNKDYKKYPFTFYDFKDFYAPFASGSANFKTMIIVPCTMGTLGRIAAGIADDLIGRAADVILKERRTLILATRETPLSLIHINNMKTITECGGIICPATPSFYSKPNNIEELASTVIERILSLAKLPNNNFEWGNSI